MPGWTTLVRALVKWGPVAFAAARKYYPYLKDNPQAQRFVTALADQTARIPERLSGDSRARGKVAAVRVSLADAALLGVDPGVYGRWRTELDELDRTLTLSQATSRNRKRALVKNVNERLDRLVGQILPTLAGRSSPAPRGLPR